MISIRTAISLFALLIAVSPALGIEVRKGHPRILFDRAGAKRIEQRIAGDYKDEFGLITKYLDETILPLEYKSHSWGWAYNLRTLAFAYRFSGDKKYLRKINVILQKVHDQMPKEEFMTALYTRATAMAYDWCYDELTPVQRQTTVDAMIAMTKYQQSLWRHNDFNNHVIMNWMSPMWAALAIHDDDDSNTRKYCEGLISKLEDVLKKNIIPAMQMAASDDGGNPEGYFYANWGGTPALAHYLELWRVATSENLWKDFSYPRYNAIWNIYGKRPFNTTLERNEDSMEGYTWREKNEGQFMQLFAARNRDPYAAWIAAQLQKPHPTRQMFDIMWADDSVKPIGPEELPLGRHFDGLGWVFSRSGWGKDDTFALFECGDLYAGHQHHDNNAFVIHRYDLLAVDTGNYENGSHRGNYLARSIAHNTIMVFDPNEEFGGADWGGGKPGTGANDGGQLHLYRADRVQQITRGSKWDRGDIVAYTTTDAFTCAIGDATRSYSQKKLKEFTRTFLHVRPGIFVIFDRVEATSADFEKRWLLHSLVKPSVNGYTVTIKNGDGRLYSRTLFPRQIRTQIIGGKGRAYEVNGKDYPPKKGNEKRPPWRIEVTPKDRKERQYFLHVLQTPEKGDNPVATELIEKGNMLGAAWETNGVRVEVAFNTAGANGGYYRIAKGSKIIKKHKLTKSVTPETSEEFYNQVP